ncbi:MAG: serpin family protein [Chloroflexota bacterium]
MSSILMGCQILTSLATPNNPHIIAQSTEQRRQVESVESTELAIISTSEKAFAIDLFRALPSQDNLIYSPYSIYYGLGMIYAGAQGKTETQMAEVLHFTIPAERVHKALNGLNFRLLTLNSDSEHQNSREQRFRLSINNSLWGQQGYSLQDAYLDTIAHHYSGVLHLVDFAGQSEHARQIINTWVSEQTINRIPEIIPSNTIDSTTKLIVLNTVDFSADWQFRFRANEDDSFFLQDGDEIAVPFMSIVARLPYTSILGFQIVELPYRDSEASMVLWLPNKEHSVELGSSLSTEQIEEGFQDLEPTHMKLTMPKFAYNSELELVETLSILGMNQAFSEQANFNGISRENSLRLDDILHKATIVVDEIGTKATAATGAVMSPTSAVSSDFHLTINRPFLFMIRDRMSGVILFIGRVVDPR